MSTFESILIGLFAFVAVAIMVKAFFFLFSVENGTGTVSSKFTEKDAEGQSYLIQLKDGRIYSFIWGNRQWDKLDPGDQISFRARGIDVRIFGWRVDQPTIVSFEILSSDETGNNH